ncbi:hypothetical protein Hypma_012382 [Hypsizygus marmoreus]|uniref:Uncharacterized protein n=1 Tax=Hypsizygus marmoreus TaxID=39966 RepID=A0A369JIS1_HYPMA|nr:hypothetical protein Hypma_012382 [Hypsizygus marmoreus]
MADATTQALVTHPPSIPLTVPVGMELTVTTTTFLPSQIETTLPVVTSAASVESVTHPPTS